jgi:protein-L-isoaspartate(D-aspartate) O-methyltransferase
MTDFAKARRNMVDGQLRPNEITDPALLDAFRDIPRERFAPRGLAGLAYGDDDLPLGNGRFLMEPRVLGRLLQAAEIGRDDVVLDLGCATGYSSAIISRLANMVVGVESDEDMAKRAGTALSDLKVDNAAVMTGALARGYPEQGPYDVILVNGAVAELPEAVIEQLSEGGRLVTVLAPPRAMGRAVLVRRLGGHWSQRALFDASVPWLPGFEPKPVFEF